MATTTAGNLKYTKILKQAARLEEKLGKVLTRRQMPKGDISTLPKARRYLHKLREKSKAIEKTPNVPQSPKPAHPQHVKQLIDRKKAFGLEVTSEEMAALARLSRKEVTRAISELGDPKQVALTRTVEARLAELNPLLLETNKDTPGSKKRHVRYRNKLRALIRQAKGLPPLPKRTKRIKPEQPEKKKEPQTSRSAFYLEYIESKAWEAKKAEFRASPLCQNKCYVCGYGKRIHIHHDCYDRLGKEALTDLLELCNSCHMELHRRVKARVYRHITGAAEKMRTERE